MRTTITAFITIASLYVVLACAKSSALEDVNQPSDKNEIIGEMGDPSQTNINLWLESNMPATTSLQTVANSSNPDGVNFRPNMVRVLPAEGVAVKGAVILCSGGAFSFRNNSGEGMPVARGLAALGYQCFVVNYRLSPYTQQEGALDLARAVRFVRQHADYYGIKSENIIIAGFSAGGILCGEMALNYKGTVNGTALDSRYTPDDLDKVSADIKGIGFIYSGYGRLSFAYTDVELFRRSNLPPSYFCWGTNDGFVNLFSSCSSALIQAGIAVEIDILQGMPHGYGAGGNWIPRFDEWIMQNLNTTTKVEAVENSSSPHRINIFRTGTITVEGDFTKLTLVGMNGSIIASTTQSPMQVANLQSGVYILQIANGKTTQKHKIIKQ